MKWPYLILFILMSCAGTGTQEELDKKAMIKRQLKALTAVRPLLKSDEFPYMKCRERGKLTAEINKELDSKHNQNFGVMELREMAMDKDANIMTLSYRTKGNRVIYQADIYECEQVRDATYVNVAGMCSASEEKTISFKYADDKPRVVGEEIIMQMARYYAIENYYKTFNLRKIKYSYTKKQFTAEASFYKCL